MQAEERRLKEKLCELKRKREQKQDELLRDLYHHKNGDKAIIKEKKEDSRAVLEKAKELLAEIKRSSSWWC
jgi:hypothetical protein